jgi:hypothetical protein
VIFTTEKIARLLNMPEWRVIRFAQIKTYGITPALANAAGSGSRRLYNLENLCEMAVAYWLVQAGLRVEVIGRALKKLRQQERLAILLELPPSNAKDHYLGITRKPKGHITGQEVHDIRGTADLEGIFQQDKEASLIVIPIGMRFAWLAKRLKEYEQGGD